MSHRSDHSTHATPILRRTILLTLVLALGVLVATAGAQTLTASPEAPGELDPVVVTLEGTWQDSCVPFVAEASFEPVDAIELLLGRVNAGVDCEDGEVEYSTSISLPPLPAGTYVLRAVLQGAFGASILTTETLEVSVADTAAGLDQITVSPSSPSPSDRVTIVGSGFWPDSCVPRAVGNEVTLDAVKITTETPDGPCLQAVTPFDVVATVGPLEEGSYDLEIIQGGDTVLGQRSLEVGGDPATTALLSDRFEVSVTYADQLGEGGPARLLEGALPDASDLRAAAGESALFWFFSSDNTEMVVKVLNGCGINDRFWVFASAATDLEWELTVRDLVADEERTYSNSGGSASVAINDTDAFATCEG